MLLQSLRRRHRAKGSPSLRRLFTRREGASTRSVHNKFAEVLTFLQAQGVPKLIGKNDHPRFVDQEVEIYEDDELSKLHAVCLPYHSALYDFFLMSGFREQETMHLFWDNIRFNANIVEMRWNPTGRRQRQGLVGMGARDRPGDDYFLSR